MASSPFICLSSELDSVAMFACLTISITSSVSSLLIWTRPEIFSSSSLRSSVAWCSKDFLKGQKLSFDYSEVQTKGKMVLRIWSNFASGYVICSRTDSENPKVINKVLSLVLVLL